MQFTTQNSHLSGSGFLSRAVSAAARRAARRPRTTIALWLLLIIGCAAAGTLTGTKSLSNAGAGTGESARAYKQMTAAGLQAPAVESVLIRSGSPRATSRAAARLVGALKTVPEAKTVTGPADNDNGALTASGGNVALVQVQLRGDPTNADQHVAGIERAVSRVAHASPGAKIEEAGPGSVGRAINDIVNNDLGHAELLSLPVTLLILVLAFGALVAAAVPLLLGLTSVAGALGALGVVSQIAPSATATSSVVVLIGLAVGIDYSLFYVRREREERRAGAGPEAALSAAAATVGRAILVAGLTVVIALAGMLFSGLAVFTSIALASIVVVLIAVTGSLTVLPAVLALLGDRVDRGRLLPRRFRRRKAASGGAVWTALARTVTRHPVTALVTSICALGALTVPVFGMRLANPGDTDLPANTPVLKTEHAIDHWFPGAPDTVALVVTGRRLHARKALEGLSELGRRAQTIAHGHGNVTASVARDGRTAVINVPAPTVRLSAERRMVDTLRSRLGPQAPSVLGADAQLQVTGNAAFDADFTHQLATATPLVIGFVLALAFVLLLLTFGSPRLALSVIGLNLLSVGAAFGLLVAVFQHHWAEAALGFTSNGAIVSWLPLFAFVILFGLSMDYTVLVLERVREERRAGDDVGTAVTRAVGATGSTVTSAALVMVAVFAVFATLRLLEFKQLGFGLAAAIALDATIVRGIALPAAVTLLGKSERDRRNRTSRVPARTCRARRPLPVLARDSATRFCRELAYLTVGLVTSVIAFGVTLAGVIASVVLGPLLIGGPVFAAFARVLRATTDLDRLNARLVRGCRLHGSYRATTSFGVVKWVKSTISDPQTWRDLGWSALHSVTGFVFGVAAVTGIGVVLALLTVPIWYWSVPSANVIGLWHTDTLPKALAVVPFAIPALLATFCVVRLMASAELHLATALLDRRERWNHQVASVGTLVLGND